MLSHFHEPPRETPVACEADLCVVGGSCTGVFAAVRAARLGLKVALVEQNTIFGGMAAAAQVNEWHSTLDSANEQPIIGGLTREVLDRLAVRGATRDYFAERFGFPCVQFNAAELALELDMLVREHGIRAFLSARCVAAVRTGNRLDAAIIEDKSGRRAIAARVLVDASGDGDLLRRAGFDAYQTTPLQSVTTQALVQGLDGPDLWAEVRDLAGEFGYPPSNSAPWIHRYPGVESLHNVYGPRLSGIDASDADQLTAALLEGRRLHRAFCDMVRRKFGRTVHIVAWPHALGVRETWHARCLHQLRGEELLRGEPFHDAIAHGTYPVDIHHPEGTTLRYLDGREVWVARDGSNVRARWRAEGTPTPRCYQIPFRCLVPRDAENLLVAGRLLDADREAFAGVRVMVNMNQTGEAAGVGAFLALQGGVSVAQIDAAPLREAMVRGGSVVPGAAEQEVRSSLS